jgi:isoleucyl-tRNA synthetase
VWYFFSLYANAMNAGEGYEAKWSTASTDPLDRYLLAKLHDYVATSTEQQDRYDISGACETTRTFLDVLTNWYIRRSRERFWATGSGESRAGAEQAFDTLYTCLEVLCRVAAPLLPLVTEEIWRGLTGGRSVHLTDWPEASDLPADDALVAAMDQVREACSATSSLRKAENLRVRLPLTRLTVVADHAEALRDFAPIIADEVNVKEVELLDAASASASDFGVSQRLSVNARAAGPRLGKDVQTAIKGSKSGDWSVAPDGTVTSGGLALVEGEYTLETVVEQGEGASAATAMLPGGGFVVLDTEVTDALYEEGVARDLVRAVQGARKDAGLEVSDRIGLTVTGGERVWKSTLEHRDLIMGETLAVQFGTSMNLDDLGEGDGVTEVTVGDGLRARIHVVKR